MRALICKRTKFSYMTVEPAEYPTIPPRRRDHNRTWTVLCR